MTRRPTSSFYACVERRAGTSAVIVLSEYIFKHQGGDAAEQFIRATMEIPNHAWFHQLMDYIRAADVGNAREPKILQAMVADILSNGQIQLSPLRLCRQHVILAMPCCKSWSTTKPIIGLDGE